VIVEATFKVRPQPEREAVVVVPCPTLGDAAELALAVRDVVDPLWIEVAGPGMVSDVPVLVVGAGGIAAEVDAACEAAAELARSRRWQATRDDQGAAIRLRLGRLGYADDAITAVGARDADTASTSEIRAAAPHPTVLRASTLPGALGPIMERLQREAASAGATLRLVAHAASGVVRAAIADPDPAATRHFVTALRPVLEAAGGAFVVERAPHAVKQGLDVWGSPGPGRGLMARVRQAFDPAGIFSPGRFVV